jgi:hypothetical protein
VYSSRLGILHLVSLIHTFLHYGSHVAGFLAGLGVLGAWARLFVLAERPDRTAGSGPGCKPPNSANITTDR